jgi:glycosyltransferase involved in cell wall biosynthesis
MRVLYIDGVGEFGGACKSLSESLEQIKNEVDLICFITQKGTANSYYSKISKNIISVYGLSRFDNTEYSYYKGFRWLVLLRELFYIPFTLYAFLIAKIKWKRFDIIHVNEITELLPIIFSSIFFNSKIIVHCRSVNRINKNLRGSIITFILRKLTNCIICIDKYVYNSLDSSLNRIIINNSFSIPQDFKFKKSRSNIVFGFIGSISEMKGVFDLVNAFNIISKDTNAKLLIAGGETKKIAPFFKGILNFFKINKGSVNQLEDLVINYKLESRVSLLGHISDTYSFYSKIDVLCFPSHFNAPGRPVLEAASFGIPSIVSVLDSNNDTFIDHETGIKVEKKNIIDLARAMTFFIDHSNKIIEMGSKAKDMSLKYNNPKINAQKLINLYKKI